VERELACFRSEVVDRVRAAGGTWRLPGGQLLLPRVFGFCRGVKQALAALQRTVERHAASGKRLVLLGQIIHNPWVNDHFEQRGVRILTRQECRQLDRFVASDDCAIVPAFGVPLPVERRLLAIGCEIVDCTCGDVRRLWAWADSAAKQGYGVLLFGRARHDETIVTKSRLAAAGGEYLVAESLAQIDAFCDLIAGRRDAAEFRKLFDDEATNAESPDAFVRLAQASQTTMLYRETMQVRDRIRKAFETRYGGGQRDQRLMFQPTVCQATQQRQDAATELCRAGCDLSIVVGGFGSSNSRHLYEIAAESGPAYFVEDARAVRSSHELETCDFAALAPVTVRDWLPQKRPLRIAVLAGASSPEIVVGEVLQRLARFLGGSDAPRGGDPA
jgi:4-hydroxy-3-methylbut-2-enyl diphosphate reductase